MSATAQPAQGSTIVVLSDHKPGHANQSLGLAEAIQRIRPHLRIQIVDADAPARALGRILAAAPGQLDAAMAVSAGHGTHLSLLALRRSERCPVVVLMKPSLPHGFFDLCITPRHDGGGESARYWLSDGPLNRMQPGVAAEDRGVILLGGPSRHYDWDDQRVLEQLACIAAGGERWALSTSRRTPPGFLPALRALQLPGIELLDYEALPAGWLALELPRVQRCWVSPDSASMVYEGLTAGCAVGLLEMRPQARSRVAGGVAALRERGLVTAFADFAAGGVLAPAATAFGEADRCARRIVDIGWV